jgi:hypothetical protein
MTLTAPGGIGKIRLAAQVGASQVHKFADGVWMFELRQNTRPYRSDEVAQFTGAGPWHNAGCGPLLCSLRKASNGSDGASRSPNN